MAVPEQTPYKEYTANGTTTEFPTTFDCESKDHLIVMVDDSEVEASTWQFIKNSSNLQGSIKFNHAPANGLKITIQRNSPARRESQYSSYNNSFRPQAINEDLDRIWRKLQEFGVADILMKLYVDRLHANQQSDINNKDQILRGIINDLRQYVDRQDSNRNQYFESLIRKQGIALDQLDDYYKHLLQGIANIAADKGWLASLVVDASGKSQQEVNNLQLAKVSTTYDITELSASDTRKLSDIYPNLEAAKVDFPFVTNLGPSLGWAVLQKQFKELDLTASAKKIIAGTYYVNRPLTYNAKSSVEWDLRLILDEGDISQYAITFDGIDVSKHSGKINLACAVTDTHDEPNWSLRSWWNGLLFKRVTTSDQTSLLVNGRLKGQLANIIGVVNNGNYAQFGMFTGTCGSISGDWLVNIVSVNNIGSAGSTSQRSELTLDTQLPKTVEGYQVKIGNEYHIVQSVSGYIVTVEMWVDPSNTMLHVIYGGIVKSNGDNANGISFKLLRGFRSASTYSCSTTMGVSVSNFGSEYNEIALIAGAGYGTNATLNYLEIGQWYSEYNAIDIFDTRSNLSQFEFVKINSEVGLGSANWPSSVFKASAKDNAFIRNKLYEKPNVFLGEKWPRLLVGNNGFSESSRYIYIGEMREHIFKNDIQVIQLDCSSKKIKNYGRNTAEIIQIGSGLNGGVTRTTLQCFLPFAFRNPSETNGSFYYLGQTSKPRELKIVVNDDNIIDVYEVNIDAPQLLTDLSVRTGTGVFRFKIATTANLGVNPPTSDGVIRVQCYSIDTYVYEAVEEMFCYNSSGVLTARKLRTKRGNITTQWIDLPIAQIGVVANVATDASLADLIAKVNEIIDKMRVAKFTN